VNIKDKKRVLKVLPVRMYFSGNFAKIQRGFIVEEKKSLSEALKELFPEEKSFKVRFEIF